MFSKYPRKKIVLYSLIILFFIMMETPMILLANKVEPFVFGLPFFLFWVLLWWFICTVLFLIGYITNWGSKSPETESK
jgi:hypothetical protein